MEDLDIVLKQANRCLNCPNSRCKKGCPIKTEIPEFISNIKNNDFESAYKTLHKNNIMSEICSIVCPVENQCMGSCVLGIKGKPVQINYLERYINTWARENNIKCDSKIEKHIDKKIAIIGSGPSGLSCGLELRKAGFDVTIFEKEEKFGGIMEYGIPDFRLDRVLIKNLINELKELGIEFKNNFELGRNLTLEDLKNQGFEYIFLGLGVQKQCKYSLTDKETAYIYTSDVLLKSYNTGKTINNLGKTVVIGGGNVAFDAARAAIRMGAEEVYVIYRRNEELMPARKIELDEAVQDGIKMIWQTKVINANVENGKIQSIECIKTKIENKKAVDIPNTNYSMPADTVVFAIGAKADENFFSKFGIKTENGLLAVDENYKTNIEGVYAGGDLVDNKATVCMAIATGKKVAEAIIKQEGSDK